MTRNPQTNVTSPGTLKIMERLFGGMTQQEERQIQIICHHPYPLSFGNSTVNKRVNELSL